jgi:hypothetical protein
MSTSRKSAPPSRDQARAVLGSDAEETQKPSVVRSCSRVKAAAGSLSRTTTRRKLDVLPEPVRILAPILPFRRPKNGLFRVEGN